MTAQDYLGQAQWIRIKIADNKRTIEMLEKSKCDLQATDYTKEPVKHSGANEASYAQIIQKIIDLKDEVKKESDKLVDVERDIRTKIRDVPEENEQAVLYKRYILNMTFNGISEDIGLTERWVVEIHKKAVENFAKKYGFTS